MQPTEVFYDKKEYITTRLGNKISKKSVLCGSDKICVLGKVRHVLSEERSPVRVSERNQCFLVFHSFGCLSALQLFECGQTIIEPHAIIRGDLASVTVGKNCVIGERAVIRAPDQMFKGYAGVVLVDVCIAKLTHAATPCRFPSPLATSASSRAMQWCKLPA